MRSLSRAGVFLCALVGVGLTTSPSARCQEADSENSRAERSEFPTPVEQLAGEMVRTALHFQLERQPEYRNMTLQCALRTAPDFGPANWQLGKIDFDGEWLSIDEAQRRAASDEQLAEYQKLREAVGGDAKRLLALARWCARNRLDDQARVHYAQILQHPQADEGAAKEALKKLDLQVYQGQLLTEQEIEQQQQLDKQIAASIEDWRPKLLKLRESLMTDSAKKRERVQHQIQEFNDPQMIAALQLFAGDQNAPFAEAAIETLSRFKEHEASVALTHFAVLNPHPLVREMAAQRLRKRPLHEFVPLLLDNLQTQISSQFRIVGGAGSVHYEHDFFREGRERNFAHKESHTAQAINRRFDSTVTRVAEPGDRPRTFTRTRDSGLDQLHAMSAVANAHQTEKQLASANAMIHASNQPIFSALETATGQIILRDAVKWWEWWQEYNEIYSKPKTTHYAYNSSTTRFHNSDTYNLRYIPIAPVVPGQYSCFTPGTPVWTETGRRPIEDIQPGDRVLAQDPDTGELALKVVISTTLRPPANLVELNAGGEKITTTLGHPMWLCGTGWRMAKLLEAGQELHSLDGAVTLDSVEKLARQQPAHNLVVEGFHTYFVGEKGLLVHDNVYREPTTAVLPGLLADSTSAAQQTLQE